jgi:hypothetical protein
VDSDFFLILTATEFAVIGSRNLAGGGNEERLVELVAVVSFRDRNRSSAFGDHLDLALVADRLPELAQRLVQD